MIAWLVFRIWEIGVFPKRIGLCERFANGNGLLNSAKRVLGCFFLVRKIRAMLICMNDMNYAWQVDVMIWGFTDAPILGTGNPEKIWLCCEASDLWRVGYISHDLPTSDFLMLLEDGSDVELRMPRAGSEKLLQAGREPSSFWTVFPQSNGYLKYCPNHKFGRNLVMDYINQICSSVLELHSSD